MSDNARAVAPTVAPDGIRTMRLRWTLLLLLATASPPLLPDAAAQTADTAQLPTQLVMTDSQVGTGHEIRGGMYVVMHYSGWVYDPAAPDHKGVQFVDSRGHGEPLSFLYGYGRAVRGLELGMRGMKAGGKRTIVIPPKLGYDGFKYANPPEVPTGSALLFEVELLDVVPQGAPPDQ
jgi:FKBP-type peptidyl-prolyl cis-trans isomerase FkpA